MNKHEKSNNYLKENNPIHNRKTKGTVNKMYGCTEDIWKEKRNKDY